MSGRKNECRVCGCTEDNCKQCIERTGQPCHWVENNLCSACTPEMLERFPRKVGKTPKEFDIEWQYQEYLKRVAMTEERMGEVQRKETRQAFFGAWGQALFCLRDDVAKYSEEDAIKILENMTQQVANYFLKITGKQN